MPGDHSYLVYTDDDDLRSSASRFLTHGLELGQRVGYFAWGNRAALRRHVDVAGVDELIARGAVSLISLDDHFRRDEVPDPTTLVAFWSDATTAALDAGFSALRVVTDTTPWVEQERQRSDFLHTEQHVDRYRLEHPFTQLCVGNMQVLEEQALAETGCIHPSTTGLALPFHLHATTDADFALDGEIDADAVPLLERVLSTAPGGVAGRELVIDATDLRFIDHHGLLALERHARRSGIPAIVLRNAAPVAAKVAELLDLSRLRVEIRR